MNKLHNDAVQVLLGRLRILTPSVMPSVPKHAFYDWARENLGLVYRCVCIVCKSTTQNWADTTLLPPFLETPERYWSRKIFIMGRISDNKHGHTFFLEREMAKGVIKYWLIGYSQWLGQMKVEYGCKIAENDVWGRRIWVDLSKWAKEVLKLVFYVKAHQKVS